MGIIVDEATLDLFRKVDCELCYKRNCSEPHHVWARGGGSRLDVRINIFACCRTCHSRIENGEIRKSVVLLLVADREGVSVDVLTETIRRLMRGDVA